MIKQLRYLCTLLLMAVAGVAWGEEESVTFSGQGYTNGQEISSYAGTNFSITFDKGTNSNAPKYYNTGTAIRVYGGNTFTVSSSYDITSIVLTFSSGEGTNEITTNVGSYSEGTWTGSAKSVVFTIGGTTGHRRLATVKVVYSPSGSTPTVATPTFSPVAGAYTEAQSVTIDCATDGATIYYTIDGTDPTETSNVYSSPIAVSETTTIKAMAVKSEMDNSGIASAVYAITEHAGTETDPYTVADAIEVIDAGVGLSGVYATGIVTEIPTAYDSGYKNITFNFVDDEGDTNFLQAFRCVGDDAENVAIGDIVVVKGNLTKYGSTYEFGQGCELVKLEKADVAVPTFTPAEGVYYGSQNVSIECETEGASVYYTTDGTEPTTSSTLYTSAIVVDETKTIKAMAVKGSTISSIVSATYTIRDAGAQGGPNNPFSVVQAMEAETQSSVFVKGIISEIKSLDVSKYKRAQYYISDNGEKENQFLIYNGYYLNGQDFTDNNQIAVGDEVVVFGDIVLYNGSNQLAQNNYIVSLNRPETPYVLPVPTFSPAAGEVEAGTTVTINIAEDENVAYVEYSFDQATWNKYTVGETEIKITEETTIYARSVGTDGSCSEVASATYTIKAETPAQDVVIVNEDKTTFLFNTEGNEWGFPTTKTVDEGTFSANGYSIKVAGSTGNGYSYNTSDKYLLIGKQGAYLTLPAFDFEVGKIEVVGRNGASGKVTQNIFVTVEDEEIAVSTETTGITGTQSYVIGGDYRAAGNVFTLKVTNGNNTQITQIVVYKATGEEKADPQLKFSAATATATLGSEFAAPTLSYVDDFDGTVKYESSNTEVAIVDATTGEVTLVAAGETTIKATSEETDNYLAGEASYTLTVQEAPVVGSDKYELVTDASLLKAGDDVVFAFVGTLTVSSAETKVAQAMGTEFGNNSVLLAVDVVDNGDKTISTGDNVMFLTLRGEENAWTFENNDGKYLTSTGKKKNEDGNTPSSNQNTIELTEDGTDAHTQAHITIAEDGEATVTFNGGNGCNLLQYNVNNGKNQRFSCYSAKMSGLQLYRKVTSTETVKGDVNGDGSVTIADVTALVNIILGKDNTEPYQYDHEAADVNRDEGITIADVTALVNIILGKTN